MFASIHFQRLVRAEPQPERERGWRNYFLPCRCWYRSIKPVFISCVSSGVQHVIMFPSIRNGSLLQSIKFIVGSGLIESDFVLALGTPFLARRLPVRLGGTIASVCRHITHTVLDVLRNAGQIPGRGGSYPCFCYASVCAIL